MGGSIQLGKKFIKATIHGVETIKELSDHCATVNNDAIDPYNKKMKPILLQEKKHLRSKYFLEYCNADDHGPPRFTRRSKAFYLPESLTARKSHCVTDVTDKYKKEWRIFSTLLDQYVTKSKSFHEFFYRYYQQIIVTK